MGAGMTVGGPGAAKMDAAVGVVVGTGREGVDSVNEDRVQIIDRSAGMNQLHGVQPGGDRGAVPAVLPGHPQAVLVDRAHQFPVNVDLHRTAVGQTGVEQAELRAGEGDPYHQPCLKNIPFTSRKSGRPRTQPNNDKGHQRSGGLCGVL